MGWHYIDFPPVEAVEARRRKKEVILVAGKDSEEGSVSEAKRATQLT